MMRQIGCPDIRQDPAWLVGLVDAMQAVASDRCDRAMDAVLRERLIAHLDRAEPTGIVPSDEEPEAALVEVPHL